MDTAATVTVTLPVDNRSGARAVGPYIAGRTYDVPSAEADRLIAVKGFVRVDTHTPTATDAAAAATTED
jgi:hypothetical protein